MWRLFAALALILLGGIFLLVNVQILRGNPWSFALPAILILLGVLALLTVRKENKPLEVTTESEPLNGATQASLLLRHGAGTLHVRAEPDATLLFSGTFTGGVAKKISREGGTARVELKTPPELWAKLNGSQARRVEWNLSLSPNVAAAIRYEGGAANVKMNLAGIRLTTLELTNGASPVDVVLPEPQGTQHIIVSSGVASVILRLPANIPATFRGTMTSGLPTIDTTRFPNRGFGIHQSDEYADAADRIEVTIEAGGSVQVR